MDLISKIAKYLNVNDYAIKMISNKDGDEILKVSINGKEYAGLASIIFRLIEGSKQHSLSDLQQQCLVYQWLEFASCNGSQLNTNSPQGKSLLRELNTYLENYSYLVGYCITIADVVVYHVVYDAILSMHPPEKETHLNLCRWFDHIQFDEEVRQTNKIVNFSSNYVLSRISMQN
ncbi:aaRS-interacting multifunctional protein 3 [Arctopsyche grandis]|uniref:aaRS-interacting multifunctional protein 3 n=1 Tax=Arctopsyche grandis TaxID=121162 RepID=UPI00406D7F9C